MPKIQVTIGDDNTPVAADYRRFVHHCKRAVVQQSWEWGQCIRAVGVDEPLYLVAHEAHRVLGGMMAFRYCCELGNVMISNPQAGSYGGIVCDDTDHREAVYAAILEAFVAQAQAEGCLLATISTPPFSPDVALYKTYFQPDFVRENFFQYLDVSTAAQPADQPLHRQSRHIRRKLNKAREAEVEVVMETSPDTMQAWYRLHQARMMELNVAPIPYAIFRAACRYLLPKGLGFFSYGHYRGRLVAGALFIGMGDVLDVYMMSADSAFRNVHANSLVIAEALKHAAALGYRYVNWQSASSKASNVYQYKASWGSLDGEHYYLTRALGDFSHLQEVGLETIKARYRWHYVLPYDVLCPPGDSTHNP